MTEKTRNDADSAVSDKTGFGHYRLELASSIAAFVLVATFVGWLSTNAVDAFFGIVLVAVGAWCLFQLLTRTERRRRQAMKAPFPAAWEAVLRRYVVFFQTLEPSEQVRFRREIQVFLAEKRITGVGTEIGDTERVLAAASAIIPIFGFPEWEWTQISEVLIYPSRFNQDFEFKDEAGGQILGMVGTGAMSRMMILAKPDLLKGFRNAADKRNVGLHEFAHLVDKTDGTIDGVPSVGLDHDFVGPWIDLVRRKMLEMKQGDSDLDPYGLTNEAEFFAVASEYFFEKPGLMKRKHPKLYAMLARVFRQDLATRAKAMADAALLRSRRIGRNAPCPCGSGKKYKKCCLRRARAA